MGQESTIMSINLEAAVAAVAKGTKKKSHTGARVTQGVVANVNNPESDNPRTDDKGRAFGGIKSSMISLSSGGVNEKQFALYRGLVSVEVGEQSFTLMKGDSHTAMFSHQADHMDDFVNLYNMLEATPNKRHGTVVVMGDLPEVPEEDQA